MSTQFTELADYAIAWKYNRLVPADADRISAEAFIMDFASVFLDVGRRVGKSTYIARKSRPGDLVIVPSECEAMHMQRRTAAAVHTVHQLSWSGFDYRMYDWIWVDEPRRCTQVWGDTKWLHGARFAKDSFLVVLGRM